MFETSFLLLIKALLYNILLPLIPGILFLWIFFGTKIKGMLLYLLWRFLWTGVVAFSLFNLQFVHFGIGVPEYLLVLAVLIVSLVIKLIWQKLPISHYLATLRVSNILPYIQQSFVWLSRGKKIFTLVLAACWAVFLIASFLHTSNFPTYADDSFGNRNGPAYNIYQDGWVKLFWDTTEILGRGRLWYPIYIPLYKATISQFMWGFYDIYINMWQRLAMFALLMFVFVVTFSTTKNIFYTLLPIGLIVSLPLVFFHATEWYMELPCAIYSVLTLWALWKFLENKEYDYIWLALLFGFMLAHIKNDGLLWYFAGIFITFCGLLIITKQWWWFLRWLFGKMSVVWSSVFYFFFFFLPFLVIRYINNLWLNPVAINEWWIWFSQITHWDMFSVFKPIFLDINNYNVILIVVALMVVFAYIYKKRDTRTLLLLLTPIIIFIIFVLVFLLTENYIFAMNQTTINRVFTMVFVILFSFSGILFYNDTYE